MSIHNIGFHGEISNIIFQLSSNTHLISSSVIDVCCLVYNATIRSCKELYNSDLIKQKYKIGQTRCPMCQNTCIWWSCDNGCYGNKIINIITMAVTVLD